MGYRGDAIRSIVGVGVTSVAVPLRRVSLSILPRSSPRPVKRAYRIGERRQPADAEFGLGLVIGMSFSPPRRRDRLPRSSGPKRHKCSWRWRGIDTLRSVAVRVGSVTVVPESGLTR